MRLCVICVLVLLGVFANFPLKVAAQNALKTLESSDDQTGQQAALLAVDTGASDHENQSPREARQFFAPIFFGGPVFYGRRRFYGGGGGFYGGRRFYGGGFGGRRGFYGRRRFG